jgi:hypothetical protein
MRSPFSVHRSGSRALIITVAFMAISAGAIARYVEREPKPAADASVDFDVCLQDDYTGDILMFNSTTGAYLICPKSGASVKGTGTVGGYKGIITLDHVKGDRRLHAWVDTNNKKGGASIQIKKRGEMFVSIKDSDTTNNTCTCADHDDKNQPTASLQGVQIDTTATSGLYIATIATPQGQIQINLPDPLVAGDTISGTVVAEPKGQTEGERKTNMSVLSGYVIDFATPKKPDGTFDFEFKTPITAPPCPFTFKLPESSALNPTLTNVSSPNSVGLGITLTNTSGSLSSGPIKTIPIELVSLSLQSVAPLTVHQFPTIGQQGRPIEIVGPFDGNSSNTSLNWTAVRSQVQDFEKNTENVSGGFGLIAESPRKAVFTAPTNCTGPIELHLKEGNKEATGNYRNIGVNLSAPKTNLLKGESTTLSVKVEGLQGITQPVPLHLVKGGVVTMQGGDVQTMSIKPAEVQQNGMFITTRTITGVQTGGWNATATVVVFDFCLQDESNPGNVVLVNAQTGDYEFCTHQPQSTNVFPWVVAGDPGRVSYAWYGTTTPDTGSVVKTGCTITLEHNATDGRVTVQMDRCTQTGTATVQPASSKIKVTITDRDMRNNTCTCK